MHFLKRLQAELEDEVKVIRAVLIKSDNGIVETGRDIAG